MKKSMGTPLTTSICLFELNNTKSKSKKENMSHVPYASVVGSLMYAIVCTRQDLAQAINMMAKYMGKPRKEHRKIVKKIFRYLKGTTDIGLIHQGDTSFALARHSDFDYAIDLDVRQFVIGYAFTIGNSLVSLKATLHPIVFLSSTEAEYMTLVEATKEGI